MLPEGNPDRPAYDSQQKGRRPKARAREILHRRDRRETNPSVRKKPVSGCFYVDRFRALAHPIWFSVESDLLTIGER